MKLEREPDGRTSVCSIILPDVSVYFGHISQLAFLNKTHLFLFLITVTHQLKRKEHDSMNYPVLLTIPPGQEFFQKEPPIHIPTSSKMFMF